MSLTGCLASAAQLAPHTQVQVSCWQGRFQEWPPEPGCSLVWAGEGSGLSFAYSELHLARLQAPATRGSQNLGPITCQLGMALASAGGWGGLCWDLPSQGCLLSTVLASWGFFFPCPWSI